FVVGDDARLGARGEAHVGGVVVGAGELQDVEAVAPVGDVGEHRAVGHADANSGRIVQLAVGVVGLDELGGFGAFDVDDVEAGFVLFVVEGVADDDEAFLGVGEVEEGVEEVDGLFLVFGEVLAGGVDGQGAGGADAGGVFAVDIETLAQRGDGGGDDAFGEA